MGADGDTVGFYDRTAATYADYSTKEGRGPWLDRFADRLAPGARVLDLGCGSGWAAARLAAAGFAVDAMDASKGLAAEAKERFGLDVRVARFDELDADAAYDGVWAAFSLLHDTRDAMPGNIGRIARALRPGGLLYLGLKVGEGEHRDRLGRRYSYFTETEIRGHLAASGFAEPEVTLEDGASYDGSATRFMHLLVRRQD